MATNAAIEVVGVDWGTTHRRAYALDGQGRCVAETADDQGALASKGRFAESLQQLLDGLQAKPRAVILSGMVGSALGWQVVPYADGKVALRDLARHAAEVPGGLARIVPGYCVRNVQGQPDVMRGEETQLLGAHCLGQGDGWFVLPGTHSKWVELRAGCVAQLRTYMTGELFDLLGRHGTLAAAAGSEEAIWDEVAFAQGVQAAQDGGALSHHLFGCRARVVSGDMLARSSHAYLSGLLIGTELHDVLRSDSGSPQTSVRLLAAPALAAHYQTAARLLDMQLVVLDARAAYLAAIHFLSHTQETA